MLVAGAKGLRPLARARHPDTARRIPAYPKGSLARASATRPEPLALLPKRARWVPCEAQI